MPKVFHSFKFCLLTILAMATAWSVYHVHYRGGFNRTIHIDGIGYNAYLPALFLHDGNLKWAFFENKLKKMPLFEHRLQDFRKPTKNGSFVNKYPLGLAITQTPIWLATWALYGFSSDITGYETPFQTAIFINNLLWLFVGLWLFSAFLLRQGWPEKRVLAVVCILIFGTNLFHFITFDNSLTHPTTLGISMVAFYLLQKYISAKKWKHFALFLFCLCLLFWIRPINMLMVPGYLLFYFFGNKEKPILRKKELLASVLFIAFALFVYLGSIYLQTGNWLVYTYQNEKFVFNEWHLGDVLLGYRCGLLVYTPIVILAFMLWFRNPNRKLVLGYAIWILLTAWVISTWNEFCYGCRLGNRPFVDYMAFLIIPLTGANWYLQKYLRILAVVFVLFCVYYNQILHYQYRHYLLDWCDVKKEQFWQVFLRTHKPSND